MVLWVGQECVSVAYSDITQLLFCVSTLFCDIVHNVHTSFINCLLKEREPFA